ncbi:MAG: glycosyltransferase family 2 protein [Anaerolineae bacterium]|jgi:cellulose synthase/poly-beta-1,6-N-acetylglucosamine synthase-like glycosyltransferase
MIIQILANLQEEGYLAKGWHPTVAPFFAGANVAYRRAAVEELGGFDLECATGEDCDICVRLSEADWELYLRPEAVVSHRNPSTLKRVIQQWFGYGLYHPYVFAKHNDPAVEVHVRLRRPVNGERYACLFYRPFHFPVVVFATRFVALHVLLLGTAAAWLAGSATVGWVGIFLTALFAVLYAAPDLGDAGALIGSAFTAIRYVADMALFVGAFVGGARHRMVYLSATID